MTRVVVALALTLVASACASPSAPTATTGTVEYTVTSTAAYVSVVYTNATHGSSIDSHVHTFPWSYRWTTARVGDFLSVSAAISCNLDVRDCGITEVGTVTVSIKKNGVVVRTNTATGQLSTSADATALF